MTMPVDMTRASTAAERPTIMVQNDNECWEAQQSARIPYEERRLLYAALLNPADHLLLTGLIAAREQRTRAEKIETAKRRAITAELNALERRARHTRLE